MQIMSAKDAKVHFGEMLDTMQREPVLLTKNNRPVGMVISLEDLKGTPFAELFMDKEPGHDEWVKAQVESALARADSGQSPLSPASEVHARILQKVKTRLG